MTALEKDPRPKRFVVDGMLGKVAKWLRALGFDARSERLQDPTQLEAYAREGVLILTRNSKWCARPSVLCIAANDPREQLREVVERVPLHPHEAALFRRCIRCNEPLHPIPREQALGTVPDFVLETHILFSQCPVCGRTYWPGSHPERMTLLLRNVLGWSRDAFEDEGESP